MGIEELKERVIEICTDLGSCLPYELEQIDTQDWGALADELANLASIICSQGNRIAAYSGVARRKANAEGP